MYYEVYAMLSEIFYGAGATLTASQDMMMCAYSTLAVTFVIIIPFLVLWLSIKAIFNVLTG